MLSVSGFFAEFLGSWLTRRLREGSAEIDERNRRFDESIRARALRLNAYAAAPLGCMGQCRHDQSSEGDPLAGEVQPFSSPRNDPLRRLRLGRTILAQSGERDGRNDRCASVYRLVAESERLAAM
jgi:hypothetical protein